MAEENILTAGVESCRALQGYVKELGDVKNKCTITEVQISQTEKAIKAREKATNDEITAVLKKRTDEISDSFDGEVETLKATMRKVKAKKEKSKLEKVSKRIEYETTGLRERHRQLRLETKSVFKKNGMSPIFNTKLYFALFLPRCLTDVLLIVLTIAITMLALPCGVFFLLFPPSWNTYVGFAILYFICFVLVFGLYFLIAHFTKEKHRIQYREVQRLRADIRANKRNIAAMKRMIRSDKDETGYSLESYDAELEKINLEIADIVEEKKAALFEFESSTKQILTKDIQEKHRGALEELMVALNKANEELKVAQDRSKELTLTLTKNYEPFIGKENMTIERIDQIIEKMEFGGVSTVGEAISQIKADELTAKVK